MENAMYKQALRIFGMAILFCAVMKCNALGQAFYFNSSTEGWSLDGPYDPDTGDGPFVSNFSTNVNGQLLVISSVAFGNVSGVRSYP